MRTNDDAVERAARALASMPGKPWHQQSVRSVARAALAAAGAGEGDRSSGDGVEWTFEQWQEWSNEVASEMPENWDGDEAQEDIILRFVKHATAHLATCPAALHGAGEAVDREALAEAAGDLLMTCATSTNHSMYRADVDKALDAVWQAGHDAALAARGDAATPTVTAEQVAAAFCEPWHRDPYGTGWPLVGEDRFCGRCIEQAQAALGIEVEGGEQP